MLSSPGVPGTAGDDLEVGYEVVWHGAIQREGSGTKGEILPSRSSERSVSGENFPMVPVTQWSETEQAEFMRLAAHLWKRPFGAQLMEAA